MSAMYLKGNLSALTGNSLLWLADRWGWFDIGTKDDLAAITDSAHNSTGMIGSFIYHVVFDRESVIIL